MKFVSNQLKKIKKSPKIGTLTLAAILFPSLVQDSAGLELESANRNLARWSSVINFASQIECNARLITHQMYIFQYCKAAAPPLVRVKGDARKTKKKWRWTQPQSTEVSYGVGNWSVESRMRLNFTHIIMRHQHHGNDFQRICKLQLFLNLIFRKKLNAGCYF